MQGEKDHEKSSASNLEKRQTSDEGDMPGLRHINVQNRQTQRITKFNNKKPYLKRSAGFFIALNST